MSSVDIDGEQVCRNTYCIREMLAKGGRRQYLDIHCEGCEAVNVLPILVDPSDPSHRPFLVVRAQQAEGKQARPGV